ncbi:MAG: hypothetical protein V1773_02895 [bacterium]
MFDYTLNEESDCRVLFFKGSLTIQHAVEIKEVLISAIDKFDNIKINHNEADEYDLTYLQLLLALQKTAIKLNKTIVLDSFDSEQFRVLLKKSGLNEDKWFGPKIKNDLISEVIND